MHIDTGHNFQETLEYRDRWIANIRARLIVRYVEDSIRSGRVAEQTGPNASRNSLQSVTLLDAIREFRFDCAIGGARRDEEKARAKERFFSLRDEFGQWDPRNQRPELWSLYNGRMNPGEHFRVFPISNWTELDVWQYLKRERIELPEIYFTHQRECVERDGTLLAKSDYITLRPGESYLSRRIRFRTIGDMTCTGAVMSEATNIDEIVTELEISRVSERGGRADDRVSTAAMEDRKREGYF
jgi:sulfate adenylyltransferase subunit 2